MSKQYYLFYDIRDIIREIGRVPTLEEMDRWRRRQKTTVLSIEGGT